MGDRYRSAQSPRNSSGSATDERFGKLVTETSKGISTFNQLTRSIAQKMSLFGTPQDSRSNHVQIKELTEKGNKLVAKINRRLQELNRGAKGAAGRARRTQVNKLSADFKNQSFKGGDGRQTRGGAEFTNYSEDQIYAQANVVVYDEDDMQRREEDIVQINHQLREVNAAFQEIDGLVQDQGEMVVEIVDNTETAKDNVEKALEQVKQAEQRRNCCACSKMKLICIAIFALLVFIALMGIIFASK
ncbi:hypothetical protein PC129_g2561 [Phytophthora cactorum]|uniref:t-SNARE coiled-coil homology domain-containing protein n=1 Tax=Phytophthora cactorum TaxID=29920 RepID=A0A8T1DWX3_9STRA|nr:hypothetical protein PC111_g228 [Phytophthora cactorum]KAG2849189.1 hypothetical protein PC112_g378 [Phytophthora cactorum]KAG2869094.1 hypothetical protein PC113_g463 [Phytophthora cactorum]KAG2934965.1 hypothetical protein PC114_g740 [Phytophthora cactorum]KAG2944289.1 hypothetical protein PC115_g343 [Phytophthora cactorum]